jgi:hypothetical protein
LYKYPVTPFELTIFGVMLSLFQFHLFNFWSTSAMLSGRGVEEVRLLDLPDALSWCAISCLKTKSILCKWSGLPDGLFSNQKYPFG